jgi:hypothetical protein
VKQSCEDLKELIDIDDLQVAVRPRAAGRPVSWGRPRPLRLLLLLFFLFLLFFPFSFS